MIDWQNSDFQTLRTEVRKFLKDRVEVDWESRERSGDFAIDAFREGCRLGYFTCCLPQAYGAMGNFPAIRIVAEEMGRVDPGFALSTLAHTGLFGLNIANFGNEEQKTRILPDIISGKKIGAWALTEPEIGSDAASIKTTARRDGNDYYLSGEKTFITNAPIADLFIVLARTSGTSGSFQGITAFIVDRHQDGVSVGKPFYKLGHRTSPTSEISFSNVRITPDNILGGPDMAFKDVKYSLACERLVFSSIGQGMMDACLEKSTHYALERIQFGQPIATYQLIQEKIANMVVHGDIIRTYTDRLFDRFLNKEDVNQEAAILKLFSAKACMQIASDTVQIFGGAGYLEESGVARFLRDAKLFEIGAGTNEVQTMVIAKGHLGKYKTK